MRRRRVLVVSACSKRKLTVHPDRANEDAPLSARERYAGRAHIRIRGAIDRWRQDQGGPRNPVEWLVVSAKFGLVEEAAPVPFYDATLAGLGLGEARSRGRDLGLPGGLRARLPEFDTAIFVLPLVYLHAVGAPFELPGTQVYFASPSFDTSSRGLSVVHCGREVARALRVSPREVASARFELFVDDVLMQGLRPTLCKWLRVDKKRV